MNLAVEIAMDCALRKYLKLELQMGKAKFMNLHWAEWASQPACQNLLIIIYFR